MPDKILTTHTGSLVRPEELLVYLRAKRDGVVVDEEAYEKTLQYHVDEVVRRQAETGIDIVNDGEYGNTHSWWGYIRERLTGFTQRPWPEGAREEPERTGRDRSEFADFYQEYNRQAMPEAPVARDGQWVCTGPVDYIGYDAVQANIDRLKAATQSAGVAGAFMPVVTPGSAAPFRRDEFYPTEEDFIFAIADALNKEYRAIADAGVIVQVDDAFMATMYDSVVPPGTFADYLAWAEVRLEALRRALAGVPPELSRYHLCWGSWNGPHAYDVELKNIVGLLLQIPVGAYAIEQANPRHEHEWRVWEDTKLPEGKVLIPGVISHATNVVEHPDLVRERIVRLARLVGRERVIAGVDCGFAQHPFIRRTHPLVMWAKLRSLVQGARLATNDLWP
jgi:5-methyltetrahydropteroyltriglutamate--homocysteine methyltransferase